jgi:hypothetical protein
MKNILIKKIFIISLAVLFALPTMAAWDDVKINSDTILRLNGLGVDLTLKSGSRLERLTVNSGNVVVILASGSTATIESANRKNLTNTQGVATVCPSNLSSPSSIALTSSGTVTITPSSEQCTVASSGGGGGGGGGSSTPVAPTSIAATGTASSPVSLTVSNTQNGSLNQSLSNGSSVAISVPTGSVTSPTTFSVAEGSLTSDLTPTQTTGAIMVGNQVFNINAIDASNNAVRSFSNSLAITLTVPNLPSDTTGLGVYFYDVSGNRWTLVPGATFNTATGQVVFSVNHLTKFAIFKTNNQSATIEVPLAESVAPVAVSVDNIMAVVNYERNLTKAVDKNLTKRLSGRILLQTETLGQAWYLNPTSLKRYYLADGQSAYGALRKFGLGIKNSEISKIPVGQESRFSMVDTDKDGLPDKLEDGLGTNYLVVDTDGDGFSDGDEIKSGYNPLGAGKLSYSTALVNRLKGRIVLQTESHGEAWYINPVDGKRYYLADGEAAYQIMRYLSLGISNDNLRKIAVSD